VRTIGQTNPLVDTLDGGTANTFADDVAALIDYTNPLSSHICYNIDALEGSNIYGIRGNSVSNRVCFTIIPDIQMPNAFIPNDGEAVNRVFEPVFSFSPERYEILIYNRMGTKLWEGAGPWDGTVSGKPVPEGVYLYLLRIYNFSSGVKELNGKVVVVYR
jgi:gliding motility-associated-like protein